MAFALCLHGKRNFFHTIKMTNQLTLRLRDGLVSNQSFLPLVAEKAVREIQSWGQI